MPQPRKVTDAALAEIEAEALARANRVSDKELSARTGVSRSRVQQIMREVWNRMRPEQVALPAPLVTGSIKPCLKCGKPRDRWKDKQAGILASTCRACHSNQPRRAIPYASLSAEQKMKSNCRAYANTYIARGKITKESCRECGCQESQMHHEDYSKPLEIVWLCRPCHMALHEKRGDLKGRSANVQNQQ